MTRANAGPRPLRLVRNQYDKRGERWRHKRIWHIPLTTGIREWMSGPAFDYYAALTNRTCWNCGSAESSGARLDLDHDHATGEFRAVLCRPCNLAEGFLRGDVIRAIRLAQSFLRDPYPRPSELDAVLKELECLVGLVNSHVILSRVAK